MNLKILKRRTKNGKKRYLKNQIYRFFLFGFNSFFVSFGTLCNRHCGNFWIIAFWSALPKLIYLLNNVPWLSSPFFVLTQLSLRDPVMTIDLRDFILTQLKSCQNQQGPALFSQLMDLVDPDISRQLQLFIHNLQATRWMTPLLFTQWTMAWRRVRSEPLLWYDS